MLEVRLEDTTLQLADLVEEASSGSEVVITRANEPVAKVVRVETPRKYRHAGSAEGSLWMADDFDAPLEEFAEYS